MNVPENEMPPASSLVVTPEGPAAPAAFDPEVVNERLHTPEEWSKIFPRSAPVIVEIGCGGGRYIISQAEQHPENNYLAIERANEFFQILKERTAKRKLANLRVCRTDAGFWVMHGFPNQSVSQYHIYFPDPWPKKRHHKRRIFSNAFCEALNRTLKPDGILNFATDHAGYLEEILPVLRANLNITDHPQPWEDAPLGRTNYEIKYMKVGRPIWRFTGKPKK